jgi:hypothetical protein
MGSLRPLRQPPPLNADDATDLRREIIDGDDAGNGVLRCASWDPGPGGP